MQVVWGELGDSPLESLSVLSSEVAVPLLRSQIRHGSMPDSAALELTDSLQAFVSNGKLLLTSEDALAHCAWCTRKHGWPNSDDSTSSLLHVCYMLSMWLMVWTFCI